MMVTQFFCGFLFYFVIIFAHTPHRTEAILKQWLHNTSIYNPDNWVRGKATRDCHQFKFPTLAMAPLRIKKIVANEIVLPVFGKLILEEGAEIIIDQQSRECIQLKAIHLRNWFSPGNWLFEGNDNVAMPDDQKLPCQFDDLEIVSPTNIVYAPGYSDVNYKIRSLTYAGKRYSSPLDLDTLFQDLVRDETINNLVDMEHPQLSLEGSCKDPSGCVCQDNFYVRCYKGPTSESSKKCLNPVEAYGFCEEICGGYLTFDYEHGFELSKIQEMLKAYSKVHTYANKVKTPYRELIQVVFAEKEYNGDSADYAMEFHDTLQKESSRLKIKNIEVSVSGSSLVSIQRTNTALGIVFGTLIAALVIFGILFYLYGDDERIYYLRNGLGLGSRPFAGLVPFSAKYVKEEDSGLIVERQSISEPTEAPALQKSFENPMFGASSSQSPAELNVQHEEIAPKRASPVPSTHENPLYDIKNKVKGAEEDDSSDNEE